jgi:hypothetical protein
MQRLRFGEGNHHPIRLWPLQFPSRGTPTPARLYRRSTFMPGVGVKAFGNKRNLPWLWVSY